MAVKVFATKDSGLCDRTYVNATGFRHDGFNNLHIIKTDLESHPATEEQISSWSPGEYAKVEMVDFPVVSGVPNKVITSTQ